MSGDSAQSFIQSQFLKINIEVASSLLTCLGLSQRDPPPPPTLQRKETSQGFTMTFLVGKGPTYPDRMGFLPQGSAENMISLDGE